MYYDYHMHSDFSADCKIPMKDMIEGAIKLGLNEICFTDHIDYDIIGEIPFEVNYKDYFESLEKYIKMYKNKISVKRGIEIGLQHHIIEKCSNDIKTNPFDFVICSVHAIDREDLYYENFYKEKSQSEAYRVYYEKLYEIVKNYSDYSVIGHLDIVKRYGGYENPLKDNDFVDIIEMILKEVIHNGKGIEINTSSFRYNLPDFSPTTYILQMYKDLGGEIITTGSDSHIPSTISYKFDYVYHTLQKLGFKYVTKFDKMKPEFIKI